MTQSWHTGRWQARQRACQVTYIRLAKSESAAEWQLFLDDLYRRILFAVFTRENKSQGVSSLFLLTQTF